MDIELFRLHCLSLPGCTEDLPFGPDTLVLKVMGKVFAITGLDQVEFRVNLKCDPDRAIELRERYPEQIIPGFHMNKKHWNTVIVEGLDEDFFVDLIQHSYDLVVSGLTKKLRNELDELKSI